MGKKEEDTNVPTEDSALLEGRVSSSASTTEGPPWQLSLAIGITLVVLLPTLAGATILVVDLTGHLWPAVLLALHATMAVFSATQGAVELLDLVLCGGLYPGVLRNFDSMYWDIDGTVVPEWRSRAVSLVLVRIGLGLTVLARVGVGGAWLMEKTKLMRTNHCLNNSQIIRFIQKKHQFLRWTCGILAVFLASWSIACLVSCLVHWTDWHPYHSNKEAFCDDLDPTECAYPFPSFHHMVADPSTKTGWRLALDGRSLPIRRGGVPLDLAFFNQQLDGFSTMAPILFYGLEGLQEQRQEEKNQTQTTTYPRLVGLDVASSITNRSVTFLWDVKNSKLVPHTARVDKVDPLRPSILLVPAQPLHHATHYAVAVVHATNAQGALIPPTPGMRRLWAGGDASSRKQRFTEVLWPSLQRAAPWLEPAQKESLQLMFDFVTMSDDSLGDIRRVRDATMEALTAAGYRHSVEVVKVLDYNCRRNTTLLARTIHGSIRVPWFLEHQSRSAVLSQSRLILHGSRLPTGRAKFVVHVPCSLRAAALNDTTTARRPLRAIVEYGHGLLYNRAEAHEHSLALVAQDQGYLIMAMDWRGMSSFDMPIVARMMLSQPNLIQSTRDNLYQGYANKIVLQHYAKTEMLDADWLRFRRDRKDLLRPIPLRLEGSATRPVSAFYGASQGGILGAGYTTLLPPGLIDRGILSVPGTSFSVINTASTEFAKFDSLYLRNFYTSRQVRLMQSIFQLALDPVEAAGMLAPPLTNPQPLPRILIQSGLGDPVIPALATEALARAYNASILPSNPRQNIFGIRTANAANDTWDGPQASWTELLFEKEFQDLPLDNSIFPRSDEPVNQVHHCFRQDCPLIAQVAQFINTGRVADPCINDGCLRANVSCYAPWFGIKTKPKNWSCSSDSILGNSSTE